MTTFSRKFFKTCGECGSDEDINFHGFCPKCAPLYEDKCGPASQFEMLRLYWTNADFRSAMQREKALNQAALNDRIDEIDLETFEASFVGGEVPGWVEVARERRRDCHYKLLLGAGYSPTQAAEICDG